MKDGSVSRGSDMVGVRNIKYTSDQYTFGQLNANSDKNLTEVSVPYGKTFHSGRTCATSPATRR